MPFWGNRERGIAEFFFSSFFRRDGSRLTHSAALFLILPEITDGFCLKFSRSQLSPIFSFSHIQPPFSASGKPQKELRGRKNKYFLNTTVDFTTVVYYNYS